MTGWQAEVAAEILTMGNDTEWGHGGWSCPRSNGFHGFR